MEERDQVQALHKDEIRKKIDADPALFVKHAHDLQDAAELALVAIEAKDAEKLFNSGEKIDHACESCHLVYWYPNQKLPGIPHSATK